jgi:hypothetical protein
VATDLGVPRSTARGIAPLAVLSFAVLLAAFAPAAHAANCSLETVAGHWGITLTGVAISPAGPVPLAAVANGLFDAQGNFTGTEARSVGGGYADETLNGKWSSRWKEESKVPTRMQLNGASAKRLHAGCSLHVTTENR